MGLVLNILGAGGHGSVVADTALVSGRWTGVLFHDDDTHLHSRLEKYGWKLAGTFAGFLENYRDCDAAVVGIGDNESRRKVQSMLAELSISIATVIHPNASVSPRADLGAGCVVFDGARVNIGAKLSEGCIVNTSASIDHDCTIGDYVHISPGANIAGGVFIGACSWVGLGAVVKENISIGAGCIIGAGSVVLENVPDNTVVVGVPANRFL